MSKIRGLIRFKDWYLKKKQEEQLAKERKEAERLEDERNRLEKERRKREYEKYILVAKKRKEQYIAQINSTTLEDIKQRMTQNERESFQRLLKKHKYHDDIFPGIFNVFTDFNYMIQTPHPLWQLWIYDRYIYNKNEPYDKVWIPKIKDQFYELRKNGIFRFKINDGDHHYSFAIYDYIAKLNLIGIFIKRSFYSPKSQRILVNELPLYTGKEVHRCVAYYLSFSQETIEESGLFAEIKANFQYYKDMISQYQKYKLTNKAIKSNRLMNKNIISTLEYTYNLLIAQPELGNEWECEFISQMYNLVKKGYSLSEKQERRTNTIVERIEKTLNISLVVNDKK